MTKRRALLLGVLILFLVGLTILYQKVLNQYLNQEILNSYYELFRYSPWSPLILFLIFVFASLTGVSLNVLLVTAGVVFNPWLVFVTGFSGSLLGANGAFFIGKVFGARLVRRFGNEKIGALSNKLGHQGVISVAFLRLIPIAPFPVVNVVAGSSKLGAKIFNYGSSLGMAPSMLVVIFMANFAGKTVREPSAWNIGWLLGFLAIFLGGVWLVRRSTKGRGDKK
ncbi:MAG: TVP38/TMEM64 family protein [Akkermansiaceae bacterium]